MKKYGNTSVHMIKHISMVLFGSQYIVNGYHIYENGSFSGAANML